MPEDSGRALQLLGLARRGGHTRVGPRAIRQAHADGELGAVVLAEDATRNAEKRLGPVVRDPDVPVLRCADKATLGKAVGRGRVAAVGVTDGGLAREVEAALGAPAGSRRG